MQKFADTIFSQPDPVTGYCKPLQYARIYVYQAGTPNLAVLYADDETTKLNNPLSTNSAGFYQCKLANGAYDVTVEYGGVMLPVKGNVAFDGSQATVSIQMPPQFVVTGGTTVSWQKQAAGRFLAGPASGVDALPTFRGIQLTDLPFTGTGDTSKFLRGDGSWQPVPMTFSAAFESAEQVITGAGLLTIAHGLSAEPKIIYGILVCKTAEQGYAVGDRLTIPLAHNGSNNAAAMAIVANNSTLRVRFAAGNPFQALNFTSGGGTTLLNANWRLILRAFA